jgi:hypothetical protein
MRVERPAGGETRVGARKAARLPPPGGRLVIHDMFLEEGWAHRQLSNLCAVHMLAMTRRSEVYLRNQR